MCISPDASPDEPPKGVNGYAGTPPMRGLGRYYAFDIEARGTPDAVSGYLVDIKVIDRAVRTVVHPELVRACRDAPMSDPGGLLRGWISRIASALRPVTLRSARWWLTPTYSVALENLDMNDVRPVLLRQRFDFAAAHRLHAAGLSDEDNRRLFGKCNNANGHGHNYQIEPCVAVGQDSVFSLAQLEALTEEVVISRFDHTHLNIDTPDFGPDGVNPSVENIARVSFERLGPTISSAGAELVSVTVWETDRTCCTYPG